jgi:hypothetical protein
VQAVGQHVVIERSQFSGNSSLLRGGGMSLWQGAGSEIELVESSISGNVTGTALKNFCLVGDELCEGGGGIYSYLFSGDNDDPPEVTAGGPAKLTIAGSTIDANIAGSFGGGLAICAKREDADWSVRGKVAVFNSTISGNEVMRVATSPYGGGAVGKGGGIAVAIFPGAADEALDTHFANVTVVRNQAMDGGGIWSKLSGYDEADNWVLLTNTIVSENTDLNSAVEDNLSGSFDLVDSAFNLLGSGRAVTDFQARVPTDFSLQTNQFSDDPMLGPLLLNGGRTRTHRPQANSSVIDQGSDALAKIPFTSVDLATDQRGAHYARIYDVIGVNNDANAFVVDIGATEYHHLRVSNVIISGSDSAHDSFAFDNPLDDLNDFDGSGIQLQTVPVGGADTISIQFTESASNINAGSILVKGLVSGVSAQVQAVNGFDYDAATRTATWWFDAGFAADQYYLRLADTVTDVDGNLLDGDWVNPFSTSTTNALVSEFPSGNGAQGGAFRFVFTILPGDANLNNVVDGGDYLRYLSNFGGVDKIFQQSDYDGDGDVDAADYAIWEDWLGTVLTTLIYADFNGDGVVDVDDANILSAHWGTGTQHSEGDANHDGVVNVGDSGLLISQWLMEIRWVV